MSIYLLWTSDVCKLQKLTESTKQAWRLWMIFYSANIRRPRRTHFYEYAIWSLWRILMSINQMPADRWITDINQKIDWQRYPRSKRILCLLDRIWFYLWKSNDAITWINWQPTEFARENVAQRIRWSGSAGSCAYISMTHNPDITEYHWKRS